MASIPTSSLSSSPFPHLPVCKVTIPNTPLINAAHSYIKEHCSASTVNHCLRSTVFAVILLRKIPPFSTATADIDTETLVLSVLLHDMGWATTKALVSMDKRFEVDGGNIARDFILAKTKVSGTQPAGDNLNPHNIDVSQEWDKHRLQLVWDSIALHTTPSIAHHKEPEVFATQLGIMCDFFGPNMPGGGGEDEDRESGSGNSVPLITVDEYKEVVAKFPRLGFKDDLVSILCGLCRDKPATTMDNFVSEYGKLYGLDGKGGGCAEWRERCEKNNIARRLMGGLTACAQWDNNE
ncbi:hypothetical protein ABEF95_010642 [Exophiala dermatitidis]